MNECKRPCWERSVNTDILLGLLSRVVPLRAELAMEGRKAGGARTYLLSQVILSR